MAGIILPDEGVILKRPDVRVQLLNINLGFERMLTGRENAIMAGMLLGKTRAYMLEKVDEILAFSELGAFFDQPVYTYSSGMTARLGFSVAIQADPDILLLDEILAVGDQSFREKSKRKIRELIAGGRSVVLVMHNRALLEEMSDRVILFEKKYE
jgi:lipopolysaccharide transport system ATP-binding protein